jgi:hypothetical protein
MPPVQSKYGAAPQPWETAAIPTICFATTEAQSVFVGAYEAELLVLQRWEEFHRKALGDATRRMRA